MLVIRKIRYALLTAVASLLFLTVSGCDSGTVPPQSSEDASVYTSTAIFKGLMTGTGEVAERFPEMWMKKDVSYYEKLLTNIGLEDYTYAIARHRESKVRDRVGDLLIAEINKTNPGFVDRFADAMTSGNHLRIQQMLKESGDVVTGAVQSVVGADVALGGDAEAIRASLGSLSKQEEAEGFEFAFETLVIVTYVYAYDTLKTYTQILSVAESSKSSSVMEGANSKSSLQVDETVDLIATGLSDVSVR